MTGRFQNGDEEDALKELITANIGLLVKYAAKKRGRGLEFPDLIQEGVLGLIKAAGIFDDKRGTRFGTLAVWWIRQGIGRAVANTGRTIRLPVNLAWKVGQVYAAQSALTQELQDNPSTQELADKMDMTVPRVDYLLTLGQLPISLDKHDFGLHDDPDSRPLVEEITDKSASPLEQVIRHDLQKIARELIERLPEREKSVIIKHYGIGGQPALPLREIARQMHMSPEGVRQIEERGLNALRSQLRFEDPKDYLTES